MLKPFYRSSFKKDVKRCKKRKKNIDNLKNVIRKLINKEILPENFQDRTLTGNYTGFRECHIEPNWLLIYAVDQKKGIIIFVRTGTHSDLFG